MVWGQQWDIFFPMENGIFPEGEGPFMCSENGFLVDFHTCI